MQKATERYATFRREKRLKPELWQTSIGGKKPRQVACALGALLDVNENSCDIGQQVRQKGGCASSQMPAWLVESTPGFFDSRYTIHGYRLTWADALYLPGGAIDRANKLDEPARKALYKAALKEILKRYQCSGVLFPWESLNELAEIDDQDLSRYLHHLSPKHVHRREMIAGTVVTVLDELLDAAGV